MIQKSLVGGLSLFFVAAGVNHFINPSFYYPLIPPYLPFPEIINFLSGTFEIALGMGVGIPKFRKFSAQGIALLLLLFIPSHIHFLQMGSCLKNSLCVPEWVAWARLLLIHPLLIYWGIWTSRK